LLHASEQVLDVETLYIGISNAPNPVIELISIVGPTSDEDDEDVEDVVELEVDDVVGRVVVVPE
jgi:hypothetical protein